MFSLALDRKDVRNNIDLLAELRKSFFITKCDLGTDPNEAFAQMKALPTSVLPEASKDKNIFTCLVRKTDDNFKAFVGHGGKSYIMERIPPINLIGIKYLLPMVGGMIDGYYDVERIGITEHDGKAALRIRLGEYHSLGTKWIQIYRTKMQPGELISMETTIKMYTNND